MRKPSGNSVIPATIHKYFGSAWDVIKDLYDNLAELLGLTPLVPIADDLTDIADNIDEILLVNTNAEEFNKHFLGAHAVEPTVDGNGDPLAEGAQYWNTENDLMYTFDGTQWVLTSGFGTVTLTAATGNGVTTAFNLDIAPKSVNNTSVFIQGVYQEKDTYTITGKQVVFNEAPLDGLSIEIVAVLASSFVSGSDKEYKTLTSGQTVVAFDAAIGFATFYVSGDDTDSKRLILGTDYTSDLETNEITLEDGYPAGTIIEMVYGFADDIPIDIANLRDLIDANTALINTNIDNITINANAIVTSKPYGKTLTLAQAVASTHAVEGDTITISDRGNGLFEYKTGEAADGYGTVACTGVPSLVLYALTNGKVNVRQFGALDTGDVTGAVQAAVDRAGDVYFPEGSYTFTTVTLPEEAKLSGSSAVLTGDILITTNLHATGLTIVGSIGSTLDADLGKILIENCVFRQGQQAINIDGGDGTTSSADSLIIQGCDFSGHSWRAINVRCAELGHCHIDSNFITSIGGSDFAEAIRVGTNSSPASSKGMMITNNTIRDVYTSSTNESHGIIVQGQRAIVTGNEIENVSNGSPANDPEAAEAIYTKCYDSIVSDNVIVNGVRGIEGAITIKGLDDPSALQYGAGCIVSNNQIRNTGASIGKCINVMVTQCSITGNRVAGASSDGIGLMTIYDSSYLDGAGRIIIADNYITSSGGNGVSARRISENVSITGNIITGAGASGIQVETPSKASVGSRITCSNWLVSKNIVDGVAGSSLYLYMRDYTDLVNCIFSDNVCNSMDRIMTLAGAPSLTSIVNLTIRANSFTNYVSKVTDNGYPLWDGGIANITGNDGLLTTQTGFHDFTVGESGRKDVYFTPLGDGSTNYTVQATLSCTADTFTRQYLTTSNRGVNYVVLDVNSADDTSNTIKDDCRVFYTVRHIADKG